jgi:hypothetical protein
MVVFHPLYVLRLSGIDLDTCARCTGLISGRGEELLAGKDVGTTRSKGEREVSFVVGRQHAGHIPADRAFESHTAACIGVGDLTPLALFRSRVY